MAALARLGQLTGRVETVETESSSHGSGIGGLEGRVDDLETDVATLMGASGGSDPWTYVKLANDFNHNATSNANVTGLAFTPAANKRYEIELRLLVRTSTTTTGPRPGIAWPSGLLDGASEMTVPNSNTVLAFQARGALTTANAAGTGLPTIVDSYLAIGTALMFTGASPSGNFQVTLASEIASSQVTMRVGSFLRYREIP